VATTLIDFSALLKNVPGGAWAAISNDGARVLAFSSDVKDAVGIAKELGENDPIVTRVPEQASTLIFSEAALG
jgi:hypothetical protein